MFSHREILQYLLSQNPKINIVNNLNKTAIDICGSTRIMKLFEDFIQKKQKIQVNKQEEKKKLETDNDNKVDSMQDLDSSLTQKMKELQTKQPGKN